MSARTGSVMIAHDQHLKMLSGLVGNMSFSSVGVLHSAHNVWLYPDLGRLSRVVILGPKC